MIYITLIYKKCLKAVNFTLGEIEHIFINFIKNKSQKETPYYFTICIKKQFALHYISYTLIKNTSVGFAARQKYLFLDFICMTLLQRKKYTCRLSKRYY